MVAQPGSEPTEWGLLPNFGPLDTDQCSRGENCVLPFTVEVRSPGDLLGPVVLSWRLDANASLWSSPDGSVALDRYSPYFTQAREYGLDLAPFDFYSMIYPFPPESLERLANEIQSSPTGALAKPRGEEMKVPQ